MANCPHDVFIRRLAKELGVSQGQITILARRYGIKLKGRSKRYIETDLPMEVEATPYSETIKISKDTKERLVKCCNGLFNFDDVISKMLEKVGA